MNRKMQVRLQLIVFAVVVVELAAACGKAGRETVKIDEALSDSTTQHIEKTAKTDTTLAFRMLDSLYTMGKIAEHTYYYTRARVYQGTRDRLLAIDNMRRAYETPYVQQNDTVRAKGRQP